MVIVQVPIHWTKVQREEENVNSRAFFLLLTLMLAIASLTGCSTDNNEHQRLVAEADLVNSGAPMIIALLNDNGTGDDPTDDYTPIEFLNVLFSARPLNDTMVIPEGGTYSSFNITHYDLVWTSHDATRALSAYNVSRGNLTVNIPVDQEIAAGVLVGNLSMKDEAWFPSPSGLGPFTAELAVTFYGHESGSEHEVAIHAGTTVQFIAVVSDQ